MFYLFFSLQCMQLLGCCGLLLLAQIKRVSMIFWSLYGLVTYISASLWGFLLSHRQKMCVKLPFFCGMNYTQFNNWKFGYVLVNVKKRFVYLDGSYYFIICNMQKQVTQGDLTKLGGWWRAVTSEMLKRDICLQYQTNRLLKSENKTNIAFAHFLFLLSLFVFLLTNMQKVITCPEICTRNEDDFRRYFMSGCAGEMFWGKTSPCLIWEILWWS